MPRLTYIFISLLIFSCTGQFGNEEPKEELEYTPPNSSLWIAEKIMGEPNPDALTYFYFVNDTLFLQLNRLEANREQTEKYFGHLSNNLIVQAFFIKMNDFYLMGDDYWSQEIKPEFDKIDEEKILLKLKYLGTDDFTSEFHLRQTNSSDSIRFEFKEHYQENLNSFISDTIVSYNLKNNVPCLKLLFQGNILKEFGLVKTEKESNLMNEDLDLGIYSDSLEQRYYVLQNKYFKDSITSKGDKLKNIIYQE